MINEDMTTAFDYMISILSKANQDTDEGNTILCNAIGTMLATEDDNVSGTVVWIMSLALAEFIAATAESCGVEREEAMDTFLRIHIESMPAFMLPE